MARGTVPNNLSRESENWSNVLVFYTGLRVEVKSGPEPPGILLCMQVADTSCWKVDGPQIALILAQYQCDLILHVTGR